MKRLEHARCLLSAAVLVLIVTRAGLQLAHGGMFSPKWAFSVGFVTLGMLNLAAFSTESRQNGGFIAAHAAGLLLAALGDVIIDKSFLVGAGAFALGHICFFLSSCAVIPLRQGDIGAIGGFLGLSTAFLLLCPGLLEGAGYLSGVCFVYAALISLFSGKALGNFLGRPGIGTGICAVGAVLFFLSDLLLALRAFTGLWSAAGRISLGLYYPGVYLIACVPAACRRRSR